MVKEKIRIRKINGGEFFEKEDEVAVEHSLCISVNEDKQIKVTCTPDHLAEIIIARKFLAGCEHDSEIEKYVEISNSAENLKKVCIDEIFLIAKESFENPGPLFVETGCAHSCALIYRGKAVCCIEDIGRHNALDKVIGYAIKNHIPMNQSYVFTSGRISGDYLQKVIAAGFPMVVSRAAVTEMAVKLANENQITMLGFVRKNAGNIYHEGAVKICTANE